MVDPPNSSLGEFRTLLLDMYLEPLPEECPPDRSDEIDEPLVVYRFVETDPPTESDFASQRALRPNKAFDGVTECIARGLSVCTDLQRSIGKRKRMRNLRGKLICRVTLRQGAGRIEQTSKDPAHYTWWPLVDFDILDNCSVMVRQ